MNQAQQMHEALGGRVDEGKADAFVLLIRKAFSDPMLKKEFSLMGPDNVVQAARELGIIVGNMAATIPDDNARRTYLKEVKAALKRFP